MSIIIRWKSDTDERENTAEYSAREAREAYWRIARLVAEFEQRELTHLSMDHVKEDGGTGAKEQGK